MTAPDLTTYRIVHHCLRRGADRLAAAAARLDPTDRRQVKAFAAYWDGYAGEVLCHHLIEDEFFFPALVANVAVGAQALAAIEGDHEHLDELMADIAAEVDHLVSFGGTVTLCRLLDELAEHMHNHLGVEDSDLLPLFERHFTVEEYEALDAKAVKSLGIGKQAAFTVPFLLDGATPAQRLRLIANAPLPFRVLYRLTRRRHARLAETALGTEAALEGASWAVAA